jgi:3,4-dihydroxy 2-butanone 4-phosphate synthase/GTP cyclohydrolase II
MPWSTVAEALAVFRQNEFVLVMDSDDREDECDLIIAAENVTSAQMAFAIRHSTGILCVVADKPRLENFGLHPATTSNTDVNQTNFYVSTDFIPGTTTGVSAADRACTVRAFCDKSHPPEAFSKPGHIFPLCTRPGGVLERPGHTESCYDLCRLIGVEHVGVIGELMRDDGTMYRRSDSLEFAEKYGIPIITVDQIIEYRKHHPLVEEADRHNENAHECHMDEIFFHHYNVDKSMIKTSTASEVARSPVASKL